jgi:carbonic anhydrase
MAVLTCSDSRVIPELIFNQSIGDIFVVRVAGNVAIDSSIISSLEYAINNLGVDFLIILGHTCCGAIAECEKNPDCSVPLLKEIQNSFRLDHDHVQCNVLYQKQMIIKRSNVIDKAIKNKSLHLIGAIYNLETGLVQFL